MSKYKEYLKYQPISGYWLTYDSGFLIYNIDNSEDKVVIADYFKSRINGFRKNKIHYDMKGNSYFNHYGMKIYFNECLRIF